MHRHARSVLAMRNICYLLVAVVLFGALAARGEDCDAFRECAFGNVAKEVLAWSSGDKAHPLARSLRTFRRSESCPWPEMEAKQDEHFTQNERTHNYGPQCASGFNFTAFEATFLHLLLVLNAALGTNLVVNNF